MPLHHLVGNRDIKRVNRRTCQAILGKSLKSHGVDVNGFHLVFFNPDLRSYYANTPLAIKRKDFEWLKKDIEATTLPTLIFTHIPFDCGKFRNEVIIRNLIETSGKVIGCFSGHRHINRMQMINSIAHIGLESIVEASTVHSDNQTPNGAYGILDLDTKTHNITLDVKGKSPIHFSLPLNS